MPARRLPNEPSLEQLKKHAKTLQQFVCARVPEAVALVREFHPRLGNASVDGPDLDGFRRADAQLVLARQYGFASWAQLRRYLDVVARYTRAPHHPPVGPLSSSEGERTDEFLRLACLTHGGDDPARWQQAADLLAAHPELVRASIHAAAAAGDAVAIAELLDRDRSLANREGGPHRWEPILYLAHSALDDRGPGRSHVAAARRLLDAGADPNAGYLWEGLPSPYTALTGAIGHRGHSVALAQLLLERGADANDSQALYELLQAGDDTSHLELLFAFGLGNGTGGPWHQRLAPAHPAPAQLVEDELLNAAAHNWPRRAAVVLAHGVDINGRGTNHPIFESLSAYELAVLNAHTDVITLLEAAGGEPAQPDAVLAFLGACMRNDRQVVERMVETDPGVVATAIEQRPHQISVAADKDRFDAVVLMADLGFDVNVVDRYPHQQTPLHGAAFNGDLALVEFLIGRGADPTIEDCSFHATPLAWAAHNNQPQVVEYLSSLPDHSTLGARPSGAHGAT